MTPGADREKGKQRNNKSLTPIYDQVLDSIFDVLGGLLFVMKSDGTIIDYRASKNAELYSPPEMFLNKRMQDVLPPPSGELFQYSLEKLKRTQRLQSFEYQLKLGDELRQFEARLNMLSNSDLAIAIIQDITDRKIAEKKRSLQIQIVESSTDFMAVLDRDCYYLAANPAYAKRFNLTPNEIEGKSAEELFGTTFYQEKIVPNSERCLAGEHFGVQNWVNFPNEGKRYVDAKYGPYIDSDGSIIGFFINARDITDQKDSADEQSRLSAAIAQSGESILITDLKGNIVYVNPAFERVSGYSAKESIGQNPKMLKSGFQDAEFYEQMWLTMLNGQTWRGRIINRAKNGDIYTEEQVNSPVLNDQNKIINYISIRNDITEQLKLEEKVQQANKMDSIGMLAGGVAHDFNNMLGVILGYSELALSSVTEGQKFYRELTEIQNAAKRSAVITRQLLAYARQEMVSPVDVNLNDTLEGMLEMLRNLVGERINLQWTPLSSIWQVRIDPNQLEQIFVNVLINARDAIEDVGSIVISIANVDRVAPTEEGHTVSELGEYVKLTIRDDGRGMPPEVLKRIFDPFFTTKEVGEGTGLGLAMTYGVVKQNNGYIYVSSYPGDGTELNIYLPRSEHPFPEIIETRVDKHSESGGEFILLVEDEVILLEVCKLGLENQGYVVKTAASAKEAIEIFERNTDTIQLLITDVMMPEMNGRELAHRLKTIKPTLKQIFMSGYSAEIIAEHGVLSEGINFIQKPFSAIDLVSKVKEVLGVPLWSSHK